MRLHPWDECVAAAKKYTEQGFTVLQQFNCSHCGIKQTLDEPNVFHMLGTCEECGKITNIREDGCNYMLIHSME